MLANRSKLLTELCSLMSNTNRISTTRCLAWSNAWRMLACRSEKDAIRMTSFDREIDSMVSPSKLATRFMLLWHFVKGLPISRYLLCGTSSSPIHPTPPTRKTPKVIFTKVTGPHNVISSPVWKNRGWFWSGRCKKTYSVVGWGGAGWGGV